MEEASRRAILAKCILFDDGSGWREFLTIPDEPAKKMAAILEVSGGMPFMRRR